MKCLHYWVCEMPNGPDTKARCKKCKRKTVFNNDESKFKKWRRNPNNGSITEVYDIIVGSGGYYK